MSAASCLQGAYILAREGRKGDEPIQEPRGNVAVGRCQSPWGSSHTLLTLTHSAFKEGTVRQVSSGGLAGASLVERAGAKPQRLGPTSLMSTQVSHRQSLQGPSPHGKLLDSTGTRVMEGFFKPKSNKIQFASQGNDSGIGSGGIRWGSKNNKCTS